MERNGIHELSAAYALHALDPEEQSAYEQHLAHCEECQRMVADFQETAAVLAFDVEGPAPPPALRERILDRARTEQPKVVALGERRRRRWVFPATAAVAAAAAAAAIGLGVWAYSLSEDLDKSEQVVAALGQEGAQRIPLEGANGTLVVNPDGEASLVVFGLPAAPEEQTYEAWVIDDGAPVPAGLFRGGGDTVFELTEPLPGNAVVAVTLEQAGGAEQPTSDPLFTASQGT
jgi:anti-sigma-K factor RskA